MVSATNVVYVEPTTNLPAILSSAANNTTFKLAAGRYPITPSMVFSNGSGGLNLFNKTNITIEGVPGLTILDGATALGEIMVVTNCNGVVLRGLTMIGMVITNYTRVSGVGHVWGAFGVYAVQNLLVENCRFIDGHDHGIHDLGAQPNWDAISTNNIVIRNNYFENFGSSRTNETVLYDGTAIVPTGWLVEGNEIVNCLRGVEPYSESDRTPNVFYNCVIRSNRIFNTLDTAILTAGSTNGHRVLVEGNYIYNEPGYSRRGTNYISGGMGINMNAGQGHIIRSNYIFNAPYVGINIGGGALTIKDVVIEGNRLEKVNTQDQGFGILTYSSPGPEIWNITIRNNWIEQTWNYGMLLLSIRNGVVEGNTLINPSLTYSPGIKLDSTTPPSFNTNVHLVRNTITDTLGLMSCGIEVTGVNKGIRLEDNCISGALTAQILSSGGAETIVANGSLSCASAPVTVYVNEWMAGNTGFILDPADDDADDWFELYNPNTFTVDLGGYFLTDTLANRFRFAVPDNGRYTIPPNGFLVVWADDEASQNSTNRADLHVNFSLRQTGEALGLFSADGTQIDAITFGGQTNNVSEGRDPDGAQTRSFMTTPTPRAMNIGPLTPIPPQISALTITAGIVRFSFSTTPGRSYRVDFKSSLGETTWTPLGASQIATGNSINIEDTVGANAQRVYRAVLIP